MSLLFLLLFFLFFGLTIILTCIMIVQCQTFYINTILLLHFIKIIFLFTQNVCYTIYFRVRFIYSCKTCLVKEKNFSSYVLHTCLYIKLERYKTKMRPFIDPLKSYKRTYQEKFEVCSNIQEKTWLRKWERWSYTHGLKVTKSERHFARKVF